MRPYVYQLSHFLQNCLLIVETALMRAVKSCGPSDQYIELKDAKMLWWLDDNSWGLGAKLKINGSDIGATSYQRIFRVTL